MDLVTVPTTDDWQLRLISLVPKGSVRRDRSSREARSGVCGASLPGSMPASSASWAFGISTADVVRSVGSSRKGILVPLSSQRLPQPKIMVLLRSRKNMLSLFPL